MQFNNGCKARAKAAGHELDVPVFENLAALLAGCDFDAARSIRAIILGG